MHQVSAGLVLWHTSLSLVFLSLQFKSALRLSLVAKLTRPAGRLKADLPAYLSGCQSRKTDQDALAGRTASIA